MKISNKRHKWPCCTITPQKRGSVLVSAMFIMMFFVIMGATLLRAGERGVIDSTRSYAAKQAYYSAKSTVDAIANELEGKRQIGESTPQYLKNLDDAIGAIGQGGRVTSTGDMFGSEVATTITCLGRQNIAPLNTIQMVRVTAKATYSGVSRSLNRDIEINRKQNGLPAGIFGVYSGNTEQDYSILGAVAGIGSQNASFTGDIRIENALSFTMKNMLVNGDLFIKAKGPVRLERVTVLGNIFISSGSTVYIEDTFANPGIATPSESSKLIITAKGTVEAHERVWAQGGEIYISAPRCTAAASAGGRKLTAKSIYFANGADYTGAKQNTKGTIIDGKAATLEYNVQYQKSDAQPLAITIAEPSTYDMEIKDKKDVKKFYQDYGTIDTSANGVYNFLLDDTLSQLTEIKVSGGGTVNFYVHKDGEFSPNFIIDRVDGLPTAVNLIINKKPAEAGYIEFDINELNSPLEANIIAPWSNIAMEKTQVKGAVIAGGFNFTYTAVESEFVNSKVPWGNTGALDIGLGSAVEYKHLAYSSGF